VPPKNPDSLEDTKEFRDQSLPTKEFRVKKLCNETFSYKRFPTEESPDAIFDTETFGDKMLGDEGFSHDETGEEEGITRYGDKKTSGQGTGISGSMMGKQYERKRPAMDAKRPYKKSGGEEFSEEEGITGYGDEETSGQGAGISGSTMDRQYERKRKQWASIDTQEFPTPKRTQVNQRNPRLRYQKIVL
jgi:hypothetical protein